jgi:TonB family protein
VKRNQGRSSARARAVRDRSVRFATFFLVAGFGLLRPQEISHSTPPSVIRKAEPEYSEEARDAKVEGTVILSAEVGTDGVPSDIKLVRALGKGLDQKAIECLESWRFKPAAFYGEPVPVRVTVEMAFRLPRSK